MVTSWPPSSMALISRLRVATSRVDQRGACVAGRLERAQAGARGGGERGLGAGEEGREEQSDYDK